MEGMKDWARVQAALCKAAAATAEAAQPNAATLPAD